MPTSSSISKSASAACGPLLSLSNGTVGCPQPYPLAVNISSSGPETALGAHGGSGLSAFGGTLRTHELAPGAPPIAHALKLELFAHQYYYGGADLQPKNSWVLP